MLYKKKSDRTISITLFYLPIIPILPILPSPLSPPSLLISSTCRTCPTRPTCLTCPTCPTCLTYPTCPTRPSLLTPPIHKPSANVQRTLSERSANDERTTTNFSLFFLFVKILHFLQQKASKTDNLSIKDLLVASLLRFLQNNEYHKIMLNC